MKNRCASWRRAVVAAALAAPLTQLSPLAPAVGPAAAVPAEPVPAAGRLVVADREGDVGKPKLDLRTVVVRNTAEALTIRLALPGTRRKLTYPLGYVSVWLDTDRSERGPEYGHFMQFWSDYRFAETRGWKEHPTRPWAHSPEGRCVATAGVRVDPTLRLRWVEYRVEKSEGCFEAGAVRVAVTTVNEGEKEPFREYDEPFVDHLRGSHDWTRWVREG